MNPPSRIGRTPLTQEYLRSLLSYDPKTGIFVWLDPPWNHPRMKGCQAGSTATGYVMIKIDGVAYKAHRLAWLHVYGCLPKSRIDHRDGDTFHNAIDNLREATQAQNCANAKRWSGKDLPKGVRRAGRRFVARISFEKRLITIGTFSTPEQASAAYFKEAQRLYGEFARIG